MATNPWWPIIRNTNYVPPSIQTAHSTPFPWDGSPKASGPPSVSPCEGSSAAPDDGSYISRIPSKDSPKNNSSAFESHGRTQPTEYPNKGSTVSDNKNSATVKPETLR